jgi:hypothetical protein
LGHRHPNPNFFKEQINIISRKLEAIFVKGKVLKSVSENQLLPEFLKELKKLV